MGLSSSSSPSSSILKGYVTHKEKFSPLKFLSNIDAEPVPGQRVDHPVDAGLDLPHRLPPLDAAAAAAPLLFNIVGHGFTPIFLRSVVLHGVFTATEAEQARSEKSCPSFKVASRNRHLYLTCSPSS